MKIQCFLKLKPTAIFVSALWLLALAQGAAAQSTNDACDLPNDLQSVVEGKYPLTKMVTLSDLNEDDKQLFQKEHADSCPGIAKVDFYGDGKPTFALALTTKSKTYKTKLVLAHQVLHNPLVAQFSSLEKKRGIMAQARSRLNICFLECCTEIHRFRASFRLLANETFAWK